MTRIAAIKARIEAELREEVTRGIAPGVHYDQEIRHALLEALAQRYVELAAILEDALEPTAGEGKPSA